MQSARRMDTHAWNKRQYLSLLFVSNFLLLSITSCSMPLGTYHTVEKGQTLWRIAKTYNIDIQDVAEFNDITDITQIKEGQKLFIPGARHTLKVEPYELQNSRLNVKDTTSKSANHQSIPNEETKEKSDNNLIVEKWRFAWPAKGRILSLFGVRNGKKHDGIDIAGPIDSLILAAEDGEVIYCDNSLRGYGNMVMLKHKEGFITIYAHNRENLVKKGDVVKNGNAIAKLGNTGHSSSPHLHFEIRKDGKPRNPLFFLP